MARKCLAGTASGVWSSFVVGSSNPRVCSQRMKSIYPPVETELIFRFLFVATDKAVKVYNTLNGHCVRSIGGVAGEKHKLVDFVLDPGNEFRILVVFTNARVRVYDWTDGLLITV